MIDLAGLAVEGTAAVTLHLAPGEVGALVMPSQSSCDAMVNALLGLAPAASGSSRLLGHDVATLTPWEAQQTFRQMGVVWREGGLVSNLSLRLNAVLPATYHGRARRPAEEEALRLFRAIGLSTDTAFLDQLPANVSQWQRRLVGLVRAWLMEPQVLVCDDLLEDLPGGHTTRVANAAVNHQQEIGYASLHVVTEQTATAILSADRVVEVPRGGSGPPVECQSPKAEKP